MSARHVRFESSLWRTSSLLLVDGRTAVIVDPGVTPGEIAVLRSTVDGEDLEVDTVLATHSDWDHVCGIAAFPEAVAAMGPAAAAVVASGEAAEKLAHEAGILGVAYDGFPRCDRVLEPGVAIQAGPFTVETMPVAGHTDCGLAFRVRSLGLLAVGDYLSPMEFPFVSHSTAAYRATMAALLDLLHSDPPETVVPGHGAPMTAAEAVAVAEADLDYLHQLRAAALGALGDSRDAALAAVAAVPPPRGLGEDSDGSARRKNASMQLTELIAGS